LAKRQFTLDIGSEQLVVEGHEHKNVVVKYLMKRRRSALMTRDPEKVQKLFLSFPRKIIVDGKRLSKSYEVKWEKLGTGELEGSRFTFNVSEITLS
tara:strand:- start:188 stop:475 length:288 start_codon:yes stop_codon:yes gene_type:complete